MTPLDAAVRFYDLRRHQCAAAPERYARVQAEMYLRRKVPGMTANESAELLANALAARASTNYA